MNEDLIKKERMGLGSEELRYLKSLSEKEYKSYLIAELHLGSSFGLSKSIGFIAWSKKQNDSSK
jgi:hypothetical protein